MLLLLTLFFCPLLVADWARGQGPFGWGKGGCCSREAVWPLISRPAKRGNNVPSPGMEWSDETHYCCCCWAKHSVTFHPAMSSNQLCQSIPPPPLTPFPMSQFLIRIIVRRSFGLDALHRPIGWLSCNSLLCCATATRPLSQAAPFAERWAAGPKATIGRAVRLRALAETDGMARPIPSMGQWRRKQWPKRRKACA